VIIALLLQPDEKAIVVENMPALRIQIGHLSFVVMNLSLRRSVREFWSLMKAAREDAGAMLEDAGETWKKAVF
jgi:hypothetical protein